MNKYTYAYNLAIDAEDIFFRFPRFPQIISSIKLTEYKKMTAVEVQNHVVDAVITALKACMACRQEIPEGDNIDLVKADGFVILSVQQAMKLELYSVFKENCKSVLEFAQMVGKKETAIRRMLNLNHASAVTEIEDVMSHFGRRLAHAWSVERLPSSSYLVRPGKSFVNVGDNFSA